MVIDKICVANDVGTEEGGWIAEILCIELTGERFVNLIAARRSCRRHKQ
jgi:hypothetical protein